MLRLHPASTADSNHTIQIIDLLFPNVPDEYQAKALHGHTDILIFIRVFTEFSYNIFLNGC